MSKSPRPKVVHGETPMIDTACGHLYVTVNSWDGKPMEVFATLGKAGDCQKCEIEALTRCISNSLQWGVPPEVFTKTLNGLRCPKPAFSGGKDGTVLSCPDAIAKALSQFLPKEEENK
jgi:hypothetical protein